MTTFPPVDEQLTIIRRGIEKIVPEEELAKKLEFSRKTGKPLRVKYGIDPTGIDVHLGHTVPLRKLRQFQELGHQAVLIIGNATAMVGDPSGRDKAREKKLSAEDVERNARDYLQQVGKVIDLSKVEVHRNGDWFLSMQFGELLRLCGQVTVSQLLSRDDFAKRMAAASPVFLHECLYPVMQAFDSVCIGSDIELGGTEQLYSFMLARDLQNSAPSCEIGRRWMNETVQSMCLKDDGKTPQEKVGTLPAQIGIMSPILVGLDGVKRMGKSLGNYIGIGEPAYDMMKKFMQTPDSVMKMYFELLTDIPLAEVESLLAGHPKEAKVRLAKNVIAQYHSAQAADEAAERWQREIGGGGLPEEIPTLRLKRSELKEGQLAAAHLLKVTGLCDSSSDARRLIAQGGASTGPEKTRLESHDQQVPVISGLLVWAGKKRFGRIELVD